ncbi:MAG TPA: serine hydrolase [Dokdonella sp.]|uniref:serine hydrolase n=1 Tax=Dokdonella sp. TaxID=2291710 RepID=UPI002B943895|nr:serine hydrolase [Xanthomonadales bacterium]HQV73236.1 serine hydrolase [Dokdonella sp.]HQW76892.1 serine hydrolase [Dokdonella sp.]
MLIASPAPAAEGVAAGFDASFNAVLDGADVPGDAWAIIDDGELLDAGANRVRALDDQRAVGTDTMLCIASLSKTFWRARIDPRRRRRDPGPAIFPSVDSARRTPRSMMLAVGFQQDRFA